MFTNLLLSFPEAVDANTILELPPFFPFPAFLAFCRFATFFAPPEGADIFRQLVAGLAGGSFFQFI